MGKARRAVKGLPSLGRRRSIRVPERVDTDKIEASFKKGVLTITTPKTAEAQKPAEGRGEGG